MPCLGNQPSESSNICGRDAAFPWIKCNTKSKHKRKRSSGTVDTYGVDKLFPEGTGFWGRYLHCLLLFPTKDRTTAQPRGFPLKLTRDIVAV